MIDPLLDVGQEGHAGASIDLAQQARGVTVHVRGDRGLGVDQEAVRLRAGDEEDTAAESAPTIHEVARRPVVVGEKDHVDADALRVPEDLLRRAARVVRVAGVGVEDAAIIVEPGQRRRRLDRTAQALDIGVRGREPFQREPLERGPAPCRRFACRRLLGLAPGAGSGQKAADGSLERQFHKE